MLGSVEGVPKAICSGTVGSYNYLVMEMVGPTLERMFVYCNRKFSLKTVLLIGDAMVRRIERLHQMSHVHRDIKPENMAIGYYNYQQLYLLDFGLAKSYGAIVDGVCKHVRPKQGTSFTGTVRYSSINALQRMTTSRRDDIESLAYVMIYFLKGRLPWQQAARPLANHSTEKQRKERVLEMKLSMKVNDLCDGLPNEFVVFVNYCRQLRFEEKPNYSFLRRLFGYGGEAVYIGFLQLKAAFIGIFNLFFLFLLTAVLPKRISLHWIVHSTGPTNT